MTSDFIVGLDLGQSSEPTALAVVRRTPLHDENGAQRKNHRGGRLFNYTIPHLERFPLGTPYPMIVAEVAHLLSRPELAGANGERPTLAIDATGVGRAIVDLFLDADLPADVYPVTITNALGEARRDHWNHRTDGSGYGPRAYMVGKLNLAGAAQAALSEERLKVARSLALAETLKTELVNFRVKVTTNRNETAADWREGEHDDLVLAVALAVWLSDTIEGGGYGFITGPPPQFIRPRRPSVLDRIYGRTNSDDEWPRLNGSPPGGFSGIHRRRNFYGRR